MGYRLNRLDEAVLMAVRPLFSVVLLLTFCGLLGVCEKIGREKSKQTNKTWPRPLKKNLPKYSSDGMSYISIPEGLSNMCLEITFSQSSKIKSFVF